jgi:hypothetical protein
LAGQEFMRGDHVECLLTIPCREFELDRAVNTVHVSHTSHTSQIPLEGHKPARYCFNGSRRTRDMSRGELKVVIEHAMGTSILKPCFSIVCWPWYWSAMGKVIVGNIWVYSASSTSITWKQSIDTLLWSCTENQ